VKRWPSLLAFLALTLGGGLLIGYLTAPGEWYAQLAKPAFNPPAWVFAPAWTVLYILVALAGWRVWTRAAPMKVWWGQLALNFLWSPVFFAAHQLAMALVIVLAMLAMIIAFVVASWPRDRTAALLFLPYAAWVAFAATLNASILALN